MATHIQNYAQWQDTMPTLKKKGIFPPFSKAHRRSVDWLVASPFLGLSRDTFLLNLRQEKREKKRHRRIQFYCSAPIAHWPFGLSAGQRLLQKQYCCMHCFRLSVQLATVSWCTVPPWFQGQASLPLPAFYGISLFTTYRTSLQFNKLVQLRQGLITESEGQAKKAEIDELGFFSLNSESCRLKQFERLHPWLFISPFILNPSTRWTMHDLKR